VIAILRAIRETFQAAFYTYFPPPPCRHSWRPARTSTGPARFCFRCNATEKLTEAESFAQFDRIPRTSYAKKGSK